MTQETRRLLCHYYLRGAVSKAIFLSQCLCEEVPDEAIQNKFNPHKVRILKSVVGGGRGFKKNGGATSLLNLPSPLVCIEIKFCS